jgi:FkbM family methyltransferase
MWTTKALKKAPEKVKIRFQSWLLRPFENRFPRLSFFYFSNRYLRQIRRGEYAFEPEARILHCFVSEGSVCLDIGANFGQYLSLLSPLAGRSGQVHGFEPVPNSLSVCGKLIRMQGLANVTLHGIALSDREGVSEMTIPIGHQGRLLYDCSSIRTQTQHSDQVFGAQSVDGIRTTTLDRWVSENAIPSVDFIKIDTEGAELRILRGASQVLSQHKPALLIETVNKHLARYGDSVESLLAHLRGLGYDSYDSQMKTRNTILIHQSRRMHRDST